MATATRKRAPKRTAKSTVKPVNVKMQGDDETENTWKFIYSGTAKEPFVKSVYINKATLDLLGDGPVTIVLKPYIQTGKKKPMPVSAIRYSGDPDTMRDLYVNRDQAESKGFTNDSTVNVIISVVNEDTISLAISPA